MLKYNILIIFMVFLFIYEPPILSSVNILHVIGLIAWIYIFLNHKEVSKVIDLKKLLKIYMILFIFWIYLAIITQINGNSILNSASFLFWIVDIFPICIMLSVYFSKKKYSINDFLTLLLLVGTFQALLSVLSYISPKIKDVFINMLINYGYRDIIYDLSNLRIYGLASNLTFSTPIVQGVLATISIHLTLTKNWRYIFFFPLLFFSAIINARTSLVIMIIGIIVMIIILIRYLKVKSIIKYCIISVAIIMIINSGMSYLSKNSSETYNWIVTGYDEIVQFFIGRANTGYFSYVSDPERYRLPEGMGILFGIGDRIMHENNHGARSDIGYINDIWLGGIFYSFLLYIFFIGIVIYIGKVSSQSVTKFISLFFLGTLFVSNIKGFIFGMNNLTNLILLTFTFLVLRKNIQELNSTKVS